MDRSLRLAAGVALAAATLFFSGLGSIRLWDEDEPKNASCAREMLSRGDWVTPTFNGSLRTDKPILLYWCMLVSYSALGVGEFSARLPSALAGVGTVLLTLGVGRMLFGARAGVFAACLLASSLMYCVLARAATPDSLLIFCITAAVASLALAVRRREQQTGAGPASAVLPIAPLAGFYTAMGLAVLAKGPIGVVMPMAIAVSYLLLLDRPTNPPASGTRWRRLLAPLAPSRTLRAARALRPLWGLPLTAAIALPWYVLVGLRTNGEWLAGFLGTHNVGRFLEPMENHQGPPFYYIVAILAAFFPGSVFLPAAMASMVGATRGDLPRRSGAGLVLAWAGCYVVFFSIAATKLPNYVVPCFPALALATGAWLDRAIQNTPRRDWRWWAGYGSMALAGCGIAVGLALVGQKLLRPDWSLAAPGVITLAGAAGCLVLVARNRIGGAGNLFVATCLAGTACAMAYTGARANAAQDGPILAECVLHAAPAGAGPCPVAAYRYFPPSLVYYLGGSVARLEEPQELAAYFARRRGVVVMQRSVYDAQRENLPTDVVVLAEQRRFLRNEQVVLVGRPAELARRDSPTLR